MVSVKKDFSFPDFNWTSYALIYHDEDSITKTKCIVVLKVSLQISNCSRGREEHLILIQECCSPSNKKGLCG